MTTIHVRFPGGINAAKAEARRLVDGAAGEARAATTTLSPGQSEVYAEKAQAAEAFLVSGVSHPWLEAEASALKQSVAETAQRITQKRTEWLQRGAAIEGVRIAAKSAIDAETDASRSFQIAKAACAKLKAL